MAGGPPGNGGLNCLWRGPGEHGSQPEASDRAPSLPGKPSGGRVACEEAPRMLENLGNGIERDLIISQCELLSPVKPDPHSLPRTHPSLGDFGKSQPPICSLSHWEFSPPWWEGCHLPSGDALTSPVGTLPPPQWECSHLPSGNAPWCNRQWRLGHQKQMSPRSCLRMCWCFQSFPTCFFTGQMLFFHKFLNLV